MVWQTPSQRVVIFIMLILWVCAAEPSRPMLADERGLAAKYPGDVGTAVGVTLQYKRGNHPRLWIAGGGLAKIAGRCAPGGSMHAEYDGDTVSFVGCQKLGVEAGKMFVKVLLPEKRITRKRGGKIKIADSTGTKCVLDSNLGNDVQHKIDRSLDLSPGDG